MKGLVEQDSYMQGVNHVDGKKPFLTLQEGGEHVSLSAIKQK